MKVEIRGTTSWLKSDKAGEMFWAAPSYTSPNLSTGRRPSLATKIQLEGPLSDRVLDAGEKGRVRVTLTNSGDETARNVKAQISPKDRSHLRYTTELSFGDVGAGNSVRRTFTVGSDRELKTGEVSLKLTFSEESGFGPSPTEFSFETRAIVDIWRNLPETTADKPNAIAVVIGIRKYSSEAVPNVKYAQRDAALMRRYLTEVLGYREENILPRNPDGHMTYAELRTLIRQKLPGYVKEGTSEVFVYYSGHGAPSTGKNRHGYLVPSDTDPNFVSEDNAYRLGQFYEDIAAVGAESVTLALDACFTGQARSGEMMIRQASPLVLSVENPLLAIENATAFLASGPKQVANWYAEKRHGMFTYFFLKGLKGAADLDGDRQVTVAEMERYLTDGSEGVPYWSSRVHQREQVPQVVSQNKDRVMVQLK